MDSEEEWCGGITDSGNTGKVFVPGYVALWLDMYKDDYQDIYSFIICLVETFGSKVPEEVSEYSTNNPDIMAKAYLYGYEVEKEPLYYIKRFSESNYLYFSRINVYCDEKYNYNSSFSKKDALKFPKEQAQALATFVGGDIEEVKY